LLLEVLNEKALGLLEGWDMDMEVRGLKRRALCLSGPANRDVLLTGTNLGIIKEWLNS
jgi:hypothetical protein